MTEKGEFAKIKKYPTIPCHHCHLNHTILPSQALLVMQCGMSTDFTNIPGRASNAFAVHTPTGLTRKRNMICDTHRDTHSVPELRGLYMKIVFIYMIDDTDLVSIISIVDE